MNVRTGRNELSATVHALVGVTRSTYCGRRMRATARYNTPQNDGAVTCTSCRAALRREAEAERGRSL